MLISTFTAFFISNRVDTVVAGCSTAWVNISAGVGILGRIGSAHVLCTSLVSCARQRKGGLQTDQYF